MPHNQQSSSEPIGFPHNNADPTKGGSMRDEGRGTRDKGHSSESTRVPRPSSLVLSAFEERTIQCFVEIATGFNLPRSVGEIFGLLYASPEPVPFEGVKQRLQLSKASTSTGLKFLQRLGAVKSVYVGGDRRSFYEPETQLETAFTSLLQETIAPHLRSSRQHVDQLHALNEPAAHPVLSERVSALQSWQRKISKVLPLNPPITNNP